MGHLSDGLGIILALLGFTFVIFIHELGHFLFAKWAGVRVERFSIGFGPILWTRKLGETDYAISLLPLGGYVKMLGEEDGQEGKTDPRSFANATKSWRGLILIGGVLFNLLSSYAILMLLAWYGMPVKPAVVGGIDEKTATYDQTDKKLILVDSPAKQLGLRQGDLLKEVNGEHIYSLEDVLFTVMTHGQRPITVKIERDGKEMILPEAGKTVVPVYDVDQGFPDLGVLPARGLRLLQVASSRTISDADPQPGERLVAIDGEPIGDEVIGQQIEDRLLRYLGKSVTLSLERKGVIRDGVTIQYAGDFSRGPNLVGFPVRIGAVTKGSAAEEQGIKPGDILIAVDQEPVRSDVQFLALVRARADSNQPIPITIERDGKQSTLTVRARETDGKKLIGVAPIPILAGRLPYLPPGLGSDANPLVTAGIEMGDAILKLESDPHAKGEKQLLTFISGGSLVLLPVSKEQIEAENLRLRAKHGSPVQRLLGKKVVAVKSADGEVAIEVVDSESKSAHIDLSDLDATLRDSIAATVVAGDWITEIAPQADGQLAFEIVRGAESEPQVRNLDLRQPGIALGFDFEERRIKVKSFGEGLALANNSAYNAIWRTLQIIPRFFQKATAGGISSSKSLHGPIGIFTALKVSYERWGFASFLKLIAVIGLNLFLVNLLPIPVVDGGQLVFLGLEAILRRPVPQAVKTVATSIGLAIIVSLMLYVVSLDILRKIGWL